MVAGIWIATFLLGATVVLGLIRVLTATDGATRAAVGDLVFFSCVGMLILQGTLRESSVSVDLALIASILGILATIALARILTRGRR